MKIILNETQKLKKAIYAKCIAKSMKTLQAAIMLGITQRTVQLNINRYKAFGDKIFVHGNTGKIHHNKKIEQRKKLVTDIFLHTRIDGVNPYEKVTYALFTRLLHEIYNLFKLTAHLMTGSETDTNIVFSLFLTMQQAFPSVCI